MKLSSTTAQNSFRYSWLLGRIFPYIKKYLFRIILGFAIAIPLGLLDGITAFSLKPYMDYVIGGKNLEFTILNYDFVITSMQLAVILPFAVMYFTSFTNRHFKLLDENPNIRCKIFFTAAIALTILAGYAIPSIIVESEPNNYCYVDNYKSPFVFIISTFFQSAGIFLLWCGAFYGLFSSRTKKILTIVFSIFSFIALLNTFVFGGKYGPIEPWLEFMQPQVFTPTISSLALNAFVILFLLFILL